MGESFVRYNNIFKAAAIWQLSDVRPYLRKDRPREVSFIFPSLPKVLTAAESFERGEAANLREYVDLYKILRSELHVVKHKAVESDAI